uniref:DNA helicase n=1 Tax=Micrococcus phage Kurnik TaxID=3092208 RepID=A0AAU6R6B0_9CAUD
MTITLDIWEKNSSRVLITSDMPLRDQVLLKSLPGSSYSTKEHVWTAPLTWATCVAMRGLFQDELHVGDALAAWSIQEHAIRVKPAVNLRDKWDDPTLEEAFPLLYPFQRAGVQFLTFAKRALLTDEMGTGKTPQTIFTWANMVRNGENPFPALVIAPNNMVLTWEKEINRWWPDLKVNVIKGHAGWRRQMIADEAHVYVINFEGMRSHSKLAGYGSIRLRKCYMCDPSMPNDRMHQPAQCEVHPKELNQKDWKTIVVDEAHRMKDPKSKQSRAIKAMRRPGTDQNAFGLTGTPIGDAPGDLWTVLNFISPEEFPSRAAYIDRYCLAGYNMWGGLDIVGLNPTTKDEFFKIVEPRFRRMPKAAVLPFLPPKVKNRRYSEMSTKQAKAYRQMDDNQIAVLEKEDGSVGVAVTANPLVELTRLTQFASAYAYADEDGKIHLSEPSNKIDTLMEILEDTGEEPLVVMAQSRQLIDLAAARLAKHKISHTLIVGGQGSWEREKAKDDFQAGRVRVILCTIAAGGIGITLTRANRLVFLQRSWSNIENKQAEDRVHRIGSEQHNVDQGGQGFIEIIDIISVGTVEEGQVRALEGKEERLQEFVRDADIVASVKAQNQEANE